jgi:hypothetical protein
MNYETRGNNTHKIELVRMPVLVPPKGPSFNENLGTTEIDELSILSILTFYLCSKKCNFYVQLKCPKFYQIYI